MGHSCQLETTPAAASQAEQPVASPTVIKYAALAAAMAAWLAAAQPAAASEVQLLVKVGTGEVALRNTGDSAVAIALYQINSPSMSLTPSTWDPISGRVDVAGDGSFDAAGNWFVLSGVTGELAEAVFDSQGGLLAPGDVLTLNASWDPTGVADLMTMAVVDGSLAPVDVLYSPIGDYDLDGDVTTNDYLLFVDTFSSTTDLSADGNNDGIVNAADYTVWRDAFPGPAAPPSVAFLSAAAAPEPGSLALALISWAAFLTRRTHR